MYRTNNTTVEKLKSPHRRAQVKLGDLRPVSAPGQDTVLQSCKMLPTTGEKWAKHTGLCVIS